MREKLLLICCILLCRTTTSDAQLKSMRQQFAQPADRYKPGVYWYFMDGNLSAATMTKDLESMKAAGLSNLVFLEVNVGVPQGPVSFLSDEWIGLFAHTEKEARRLGIEITLGIGPGWTGSGGPWVKGEQSMQHLVASKTVVHAGDRHIVLPVPPPRRPFFGEGGLTPAFKKEWLEYYEDVAVLAFPAPAQDSLLPDIDEKALYVRAPYTSSIVKPHLPTPSSNRSSVHAIAKHSIIDLTARMRPDGRLNWSPPPGKWTVMRFVSRNNGAITRPAPAPGIGMEANKFDTAHMNDHLAHYIGRLLQKTGLPDPGITGGLKRLHMDSWEMGAQNWTARFRQEFMRRRGYDPQPWYPVYAGNIVGSAEESERFLWDLRKTCAELVLDYHARHVKNYAARHGMELSIEPYDMTPLSDLDLGSVADVPMGEFWSRGFGFNASFSILEATSVGHVNGQPLIPAEAFTAQNNEGWKQHPASVKNQGDWAFAAGVTRFVYHTFQNQFLADSLRPGATMGPYGVHWDRGQTWWPMAAGYHQYITRNQFMLQQGRTVADILYLAPEGSPHVFLPPPSALAGDTLCDRKGYNFDGCTPEQLKKATVKNGRVVFPGGASYAVLVLPVYASMTPEVLALIGRLVQQGAMVIGNPPLRSPSLVGYPGCDQRVAQLVRELWGTPAPPDRLAQRAYGKGRLVWGKPLAAEAPSLYPPYAVAANVLSERGIREDFVSDTALRYTHRTGHGWDLYFVSNKTGRPVQTVAQFRGVKGAPERWDANTGTIRPIHTFETGRGFTSVALQLDAYESVLILFAADDQRKGRGLQQAPAPRNLLTLNGPWEVQFDPQWGGPAAATFPALTDWSQHPQEGIRYYSGKAVYRQQFRLSEKPAGNLYLHLGTVHNIARVALNGKDLGIVWCAPWQVAATDALRAGTNDLTIEVINLWPNRLIGDEQKPYDGIVQGRWPEWLQKGQPRTSGRYTFTTTRQYNAQSPLLPSGLIGPVVLTQHTF